MTSCKSEAMSLSKDWSLRAQKHSSWLGDRSDRSDWKRPVRVASDCSGLTTPEIALQEVLGPKNVHSVFACDSLAISRRMAASIHKPDYIFPDMLDRTFLPTQMQTTDQNGKPVTLTRDEAKLDFYIAGTMCTPFSRKGAQQGFSDPNAQTLVNFLKTAAVLRPRALLLENVVTLLGKAHVKQFKDMLAAMPEYHFIFRVYTSDVFGIPQARERFYCLGILVGELRLKSLVKSDDYFDKVVKHLQPNKPADSFVDFLQLHGCPVAPWLSSDPSDQTHDQDDDCEDDDCPSDALCKCSPRHVCPMHPCRCQTCKKHGEKSRKCKWRNHTIQHNLTKKNNRRTYLAAWRRVSKNQKLKSAPTYLKLAVQAKLAVSSVIKSPRERCLLDALSSTRNLMEKHVIVDISQSVHRPSLRADGLVMTIGTGSTRLLVTQQGRFLNETHCMALNGMDAGFFKAQGATREDLHFMAGNAMCLPVVGSVLVAAGAIMKWR